MDERASNGLPTEMSVVDKAVGLAMWVPGLLWLSSMMSVMTVVNRIFPPHKVDFLARIYTRGQVVVSGSKLRFHVHPDIDPKGIYMFAQNHVNMMDHCTCYTGTPHFKQGIELAAHFKLPIYGWYMKGRGTIPVRGDVSPKQAYKELSQRIRAEVERGHSLLLFPEGTRTLDGRVGPFQPGVFRIARELEIPIVPVAITGMFEVMHKGAPYINPGHRVDVYYERPIPTKGVPKNKIGEIVAETRRVIAARVDAFYDGGVVATTDGLGPIEQGS
jgi:1-acyl-sn-glycerol-3-phosphate acyltransferase